MPLHRESSRRPRCPAFSPPSSQRTGRYWYKADSRRRRRRSSQPRRRQSSPHRRQLCSPHRRQSKRRRQCRHSSLARRRRSSPLRRRQCSRPRRRHSSRPRRHLCSPRRRQLAGSPRRRQRQAPATSTPTMASAALARPLAHPCKRHAAGNRSASCTDANSAHRQYLLRSPCSDGAAGTEAGI